MEWTIDSLFDVMTRQHASDLVLAPGSPPVLWTMGAMHLVDSPPLASGDVQSMFAPSLAPEHRQSLDTCGDADFSLGRDGLGRFRVNLHRQRGSWSAAVRFVPHTVPSFEQLKLPAKVLEFADLPNGLVLVTGGTGNGKSTTLGAMIDYINKTYQKHIITLEDPIEYTHAHRRSIIEQREIGSDCSTFASALRHVVRQRPDVILVGEIRDLETISAALTAAETGHLVMASLHTINASQTVERIVDVFPPAQQTQVRVQLAGSLQGVVSQALFRDQLDGTMAPAVEIMTVTPGIRRAIRENETHLLPGMIETGRALGMTLLDASIAELVRAGRITMEQAQARAANPDRLARLVA